MDFKEKYKNPLKITNRDMIIYTIKTIFHACDMIK